MLGDRIGLRDRGVGQNGAVPRFGIGQTHTVSGFDFQVKVDGKGPEILQNVGRKVFDTETGEVVFLAGHADIPDGPEAEAVFCAALA